MAHLYLFRPADHIPIDVAKSQFEGALSADSEKASRISGVDLSLRVAAFGRILIGQVSFDTGLSGWEDWYQDEEGGIAWGGVCEEFLGEPVDASLRKRVLKLLKEGGEPLGVLSGSFTAVVWDITEEQVIYATSTGEAPSAWHTSGSRGWACGVRSTVLSSLAGLDFKLNTIAAHEFLTFGYLLRPHSLFSGITRIRGGTRIRISGNDVPKFDRYWSLGEAIQCEPATGLTRRDVEDSTEYLRHRLQRQLQFSRYPQCLITGGKDSRCIAAGLVASGYAGSAQTSGAAGTPDVILGRRVAKYLGLTHEHLRPSSIDVVAKSENRLIDWAWLTSGRDILRHALSYHGFFDPLSLPGSKPRQVFHGSNVIGGDAFTPSSGFDHLDSQEARIAWYLQNQSVRQLTVEQWFPGLLREVTDETLESLSVKTGDFGQFLQILYWQRRCQHLFGDSFAAKDFWTHRWTPLEGLHFMRAGLRLLPEQRFKRTLTVQVTLGLMPGLKNMGFLKDYEKGRGLRQLMWHCYKAVMGYHPRFAYLGHRRCSAIPQDKSLHEFWRQSLLSHGAHPWMDLVNPKLIRELAQSQPLSELLWRTATLEMFIKTFDGSHEL